MNVWFQIKSDPSIIKAPRILFEMMKRSQAILAGELLDDVLDCVRRNSFYFHPENLLVSMLYDDQLQIRQRAAFMIADSRANPQEAKRRAVNKAAKRMLR